jgi:hypothetical protein
LRNQVATDAQDILPIGGVPVGCGLGAAAVFS